MWVASFPAILIKAEFLGAKLIAAIIALLHVCQGPWQAANIHSVESQIAVLDKDMSINVCSSNMYSSNMSWKAPSLVHDDMGIEIWVPHLALSDRPRASPCITV